MALQENRIAPCSLRSPVHALTRSIPIVVISGLLKAGFPDSLAHPGTSPGGRPLGGELDGKRLELLRERVPAATQIPVLADAGSPLASLAALRLRLSRTRTVRV